MARPADLLRLWVTRQACEHAAWFEEQLKMLAGGATDRQLHVFLGLAPRRLGKADLVLTDEDAAQADVARPGWRPVGWSIDGAARVAAILVHRGNGFDARFRDLRRTADVSELIALYRGLPLYPDPEKLEFEVGEGLRSNMRAVFEAIAHNNPYPRDYFDQHRWNHMVLKALFIGSRLSPIIGLDERANPELARILIDYAHERWAAQRPVAPELWRCVGPFATTSETLDDLGRALSGNAAERAAAILALAASPTPGARDLLASEPALAAAAARGQFTWDSLPIEEAV